MIGAITSAGAGAAVSAVRPVRNNRAPDLEAQALLLKLAKTDREVRAHEQAHMAAGGAYTRGGPTYTYQRGPDGRLYAVGGEVSIDTSPVAGDPEATLRKANTVRAAALAPAEPSSADRAVAGQAAQMAAAAQAEIAQRRVASAYAAGREPAAVSFLA
ncbi:MAG: hypothetical protein JNK48_12315 [Bryobacterales bacterium]|nr:hypothetical protein [Bryobacterales bacterium]